MAKRPSLDIALGSPDIEAFKGKMNEASNHVGTVARQMARRFLDMNDELKAGLLASASSMALGMVGRIALVVGGFKLMSDAIGATRDQLKEMVAIADKAENLGVSPQFLQSFTGEARKLKIEAGELESALSSAFNATKDRSPINIGEWETGKEKISDVEKTLRVLNATVAGGRLEGLVLFRDADTQEKKVVAVLKAMQQLEQIGQRAAALDLGEKMFGSQFVDRIRQGKTSADSMLVTMQKLSVESGDIFPNDLMVRAKQIDDQLKLAENRLTTALKPAFNDLADGMLTIKGYWADVVNLIGQAVDWTNKLGLTSETMRKKSELAAVNEAIKNGTGIWGVPQVPEGFLGATPRADLAKRRDRLQGDIDAAERQPNVYPEQPTPSRGTGDAPTRKPTDTGVDKLDSATENIAKRTAALQAEAAAIDLGTEAREKAKITAQLETVAKQANAAAGKGENLVTAEQRKLIDDVAAGYANAAQAMEKARVASSIKFGRATSMLDPSDAAIAQQLRDIYPDVATALGSVEAQAMRTNEAMKGIAGTMSSSLTSGLTDILDGTKSVSAGFAGMGKVVIRAIEEMIVKMLIVQPLMRGLQGSFGFADGGAVALPGSADFIGPVAKATGGMINGPGTGTSDSIPARLSDGEFVVNARATSKNRALLEAINGGHLRGFATGGLVSDVPTPSGAAMVGGQTVNNHVSVNVNGSAGTPAQNADLAAQIGKQVEASVRQLAMKELRLQMRPGGVMRS
jgi:hypothetical protein